MRDRERERPRDYSNVPQGREQNVQGCSQDGRSKVYKPWCCQQSIRKKSETVRGILKLSSSTAHKKYKKRTYL